MVDHNYYFSSKQYKRRGYRQNKVPLLLISLALILVLLLLYYRFFFNNAHIILAHYAQVIDGFETKGLVIREERVRYSPYSGYIVLRKKEGERVDYGNEVIRIDDQLLYNYRPGLISYSSDGLEEVLRPERLAEMTIKDFRQARRDFNQLVNGNYLKKGQAAFRIIDNNQMYVVIKTEAIEVERYRINETVFFQSDQYDYGLIDGRVAHKIVSGEQGLIIVALNLFVKEWLNLRWLDLKFIKNIYRGIVIPRKAIFTQPEGEGVLIYQPDGTYSFREIRIVNGNADEVVVNGVEVGESVIENPAAVNFGREG